MTAKHFKQIVPQTKTRSIGFTPAHMTTPLTRANFHRLSRSLTIGTTVSFIGILGGIIPNATVRQPNQILSNAARADEVSTTPRRNHANAPMPSKSLRRSNLAQAGEELAKRISVVMRRS